MMFVGIDDPMWRKLAFSEGVTVSELIGFFEAHGLQAALVLDSEGRVCGTVSDGDIRRSLYRGVSLDVSISEIMCKNPVVVPPGALEDDVISLMEERALMFVPCADHQGYALGCWLARGVSSLPSLSNKIVIMAGGLGSRLGHLTADCPKPLLKVSGQPIIERIISSAKSSGFRDFIVSVNYLAQSIMDQLGNGERMGVTVSYVREDTPLGTVGSLSLIERGVISEDFIVINGDVLTNVCLRKFLNSHQDRKADVSMAVAKHTIVNPFGTVEIAGDRLISFKEKPVYESIVNTGIYALTPAALSFLKKNAYCDMPSLFERVIEDGGYASVFPVSDGWMDIGQPDDLARARTPRDSDD